MSCSVAVVVRLHEAGDQLGRNLWFFSFLLICGSLTCMFLANVYKSSVVFGHFVPDFALILSLLNQSTLIFVPFVNLVQSLKLIFLGLYLCQVGNHRVKSLIGYHFIRIID